MQWLINILPRLRATACVAKIGLASSDSNFEGHNRRLMWGVIGFLGEERPQIFHCLEEDIQVRVQSLLFRRGQNSALDCGVPTFCGLIFEDVVFRSFQAQDSAIVLSYSICSHRIVTRVLLRRGAKDVGFTRKL